MTECAEFSKQCFLAYNLSLYSPIYFPWSQSSKHIKSPLTIMDGDPVHFINRFIKSKVKEEFLDITNDKLALLTPEIKLYKTIYAGKPPKPVKDIPFIFRDHVDYGRIESIMNSASGRAGGFGIKSLSANFHGKTDIAADKVIDVNISFFAQNIDEIFKPAPKGSAEYIDLISFSPGSKKKKKPSQISSTGDCAAVPVEEIANPIDFQVKLEMGWAVPKQSAEYLGKGLFKAVQKSKMVMLLSLIDHDINFNQDGTVELNVRYMAGFETLFDSYRADILNINKQLADKSGAAYSAALAKTPTNVKESMDNQKITDHAAYSATKAGKEFKPSNFKLPSDEKERQAALKSLAVDEASGAFRSKISDIMQEQTVVRYLQRSNIEKLIKHIESKNGIFIASMDDGAMQKYSDKICQKRSEIQTAYKIGATKANIDALKDEMSLLARQRPKGGAGTSTGADTAAEVAMGQVDNAIQKSNAAMINNRNKKSKVTSGQKAVVVPDLKDPYNDYIPYVYFGDLVDAALTMISGPDSLPGDALKYRVILGPMTFKDPSTGKKMNISLADIPIALPDYMEWLNANIIGRNRRSMTFKKFLERTIKELVIRSLGRNCFLPDNDHTKNIRNDLKLGMQEVIIAGKKDGKDPLHKKSRVDVETFTNKIYKHDSMELIGVDTKKLWRYLLVYVHASDPSHMTGDMSKDKRNGIYHFSLGRDRGLIKNISFSKVDMPGFKEMNIVGSDNPMSQLKLPYNANVSMIGNTFFLPGAQIMINPSVAALGDPRSPSSYASKLGLGGYYIITAVDHQINGTKFETQLKAIYTGWPQACSPPVSPAKNYPWNKKEGKNLGTESSPDQTPESTKQEGSPPAPETLGRDAEEKLVDDANLAYQKAAASGDLVGDETSEDLDYGMNPMSTNNAFAGRTPPSPSIPDEIKSIKEQPPRIVAELLEKKRGADFGNLCLEYLQNIQAGNHNFPIAAKLIALDAIPSSFKSTMGNRADVRIVEVTFQYDKQVHRADQRYRESNVVDRWHDTDIHARQDERDRFLDKSLGYERVTTTYIMYCYRNERYGWVIYDVATGSI